MKTGSDAVAGAARKAVGRRRVDVRVSGRTYSAVLTPDRTVGGYSIEVPDLPGVVTEADSVPEARKKAADAIRLWLGAARRAGRRT